MTSLLPRHIAIVMDGNGRWAESSALSRIEGHRAGVGSAEQVIEICSKKGVEILTLFAFSSENWQRPMPEVNALMELFAESLKQEVNKLHKNRIQVHFIGDRSSFGPNLRSAMDQAETLTADNQGLKLVIAANYGGRWDIVNAARLLVQEAVSGRLELGNIDSECFSRHLSLAHFSEPDLFIRTGGEKRISNFLLWHLAYTELYFSDVYWPDFREEEMQKALDYYASRQRRFGCTAQQVESRERV